MNCCKTQCLAFFSCKNRLWYNRKRAPQNLANIACFFQNLPTPIQAMWRLEAYERSIKADPLERDASPLWHAGQIHILRSNWEAAENTLRKVPRRKAVGAERNLATFCKFLILQMFWRARSRLYRSRFLRVNMCLPAFSRSKKIAYFRTRPNWML